MRFGECVQKLNAYTANYGWQCRMNSWIRKKDQERVWMIELTKGPVVVHATGKNLMEASEEMLRLLAITERIALTV